MEVGKAELHSCYTYEVKKYLFAGSLALLFFLIQLLTLSDYGMNWDSPFRFLRGQAYLQFFLTGKTTFGIHRELSPAIYRNGERVTRFDPAIGEGSRQIALPTKPLFLEEFTKQQKSSAKLISFYEDDSYNISVIESVDGGHPPFPDIVASIFNRIFYQTLHVLGDVQSYHLSIVFFASIGIFLIFLFTFELSQAIGFDRGPSMLAALIASMSFGLYPLFFSESHFNLKDPLIAVLFLGVLWSFWKWILTNHTRWGVFFFIFLGISLTTKWSIALVPAILLPWIGINILSPKLRKWVKIKKIILFFVLGTISIGIFFIVLWPFIWSDPIGKIVQILQFYKNTALQDTRVQPTGFIGPFGINVYPAYLFLVSTPEILLALFLSGIWVLVQKSTKANLFSGVLLILWLFMPIAVISMPHVWFYSGLRQIIEIIPALCIVCGIGAGYLLQRIFNFQFSIFKKTLARFTLSTIWTLGIFTLLVTPITHLHPNENLYFNSIAGGIRGAFQKGLIDPKTNYGNLYKQAADWLNAHAERNAQLTILDGNMFALSPTFLQKDISESPYNFSGFDQKGEYSIEIYDPAAPSIFAYRYQYRFLNPVYTLRIDGAPMLKIFHNSPENAKITHSSQQEMTNFLLKQISTPQGNGIGLNLGKEMRITQIIVRDAPKQCQFVSFKFGDEQVEFYDSNRARRSVYEFNEKTILGDNTVAYSFPGDIGEVIIITPLDSKSCFAGGTITAVHFLP